MKKYAGLALWGLLIAAAVADVAYAADREAPLFALDRGVANLSAQGKFIDERVADFMAANYLPGMTMAIVQAPYIPRSAGYGRSSARYDELASTRTMWSIGPITQAFTDVAIMQLFERDKLDINAPIGKYLAGLPASWQPVTIYQLMQHASGIDDYRKSLGFSEVKQYRPNELLDMVKATPLLFEPGTEVRQSATNYALLALVIERTSGMPFQKFIRKYQIEPLALQSTMFAEDLPNRSMTDRPTPNPHQNQHSLFADQIPYVDPIEAATGYRGERGDATEVASASTQNLFGFGNLWSSADDISKWDIALAGNILIKKQADREMIYSPTTLKNGSVIPAFGGWEFTHHPGFMEIKGNAPGFSAYLSRFTAKDELVCVTLLTNREGVDLTGLARDIAEAYMAGLGSGLNSDRIVNQESKFGVDATVDRIKEDLAANHVPVFASIDHGDNATKAGLALAPAKVLVFGNPSVGTKLMQADIAMALDLPLRVAVWQDQRGRVWVSYHDVAVLQKEYGVTDSAMARAIDNSLATLVKRAVNVYDY